MAEGGSPLRRNRLWLWGTIGTAFYVIFLLTFSGVPIKELSELKLNELGDFLAGVFAPLAFFWLVLGFFQQGAELRISSDALWVQSEELRKSVEHQEDLVLISRSQFEHQQRLTEQAEKEQKLRRKPILRVNSGAASISPPRFSADYRLVNAGHKCTDLQLRMDQEILGMSNAGPIASLPEGEMHAFRMAVDMAATKDGFLEVHYTDADGERKVERFKCGVEGTGHERRFLVASEPVIQTDC